MSIDGETIEALFRRYQEEARRYRVMCDLIPVFIAIVFMAFTAGFLVAVLLAK